MERLEWNLEIARHKSPRRVPPCRISNCSPLRPHAEMADCVGLSIARSVRLDCCRKSQRKRLRVWFSVQRHDVPRRPLRRVQRRRNGVHVRQYRRVIGVLLEHHEDVHFPLLVLVLRVLRDCPAILRIHCSHLPDASTCFRVSNESIGPLKKSNPIHDPMFLLQPWRTTVGHIRVSPCDESFLVRTSSASDATDTRSPTTNDAAITTASTTRSPSGTTGARPLPVTLAVIHDSANSAQPITSPAAANRQPRVTNATNAIAHTKLNRTWLT